MADALNDAAVHHAPTTTTTAWVVGIGATDAAITVTRAVQGRAMYSTHAVKHVETGNWGGRRAWATTALVRLAGGLSRGAALLATLSLLHTARRTEVSGYVGEHGGAEEVGQFTAGAGAGSTLEGLVLFSRGSIAIHISSHVFCMSFVEAVLLSQG